MKMKKIALFTMAAITFAACSNEDDVLNTGMTESQFRENEVILVPEVPGGTRNAVTPDLVNVWEVGDTVGASVVCGSTTIENGVFIAKEFTIHERTLIGFQSDGTVDWQDGSSNHNFYIYYPYVAGATHTAVPVTLNSVQTKAVPNLFLWAASTNLKKPADNAVPFAAKRLLPVAEFNIIRDDETLDGYTLDNIVVKPTDGSTMATGTTNVNLETLGNATSVSFSGTAAQYQLNYAVAVSTIGMDDSKSVYMSLPPAAAKEYTITATFKKGTDTKTIAVTRTNAFTIAYGKGNFVRYYLKSSNAKKPSTVIPGTGDEVNTGTVIWAPANLVYIDNVYRFAKNLGECYPDEEYYPGISTGIISNSSWQNHGSKACYWQYGQLNVSDASSSFTSYNPLISGTTWPTANDPCSKVSDGEWRLPTLEEMKELYTWMGINASVITSVTQGTTKYNGYLYGQKNSDGTFADGAAFFPAAGYRMWSSGNIQDVGTALWLWGGTEQASLAKGTFSGPTSQGAYAKYSYQANAMSIRCVKTAE